MFRSEEQMKIRRSRLDGFKKAFEGIGVGTTEQHFEGMPQSMLTAYINYGYGGQRQVFIAVKDDGETDVYMSGIYTLPDGRRGDQVEFGQIPRIFGIPASSSDDFDSIVKRIQQESVNDSTSCVATPFPKPPYPIPFGRMQTVADLIDAYRADATMSVYKDVLLHVLAKTGVVQHAGQEWSRLGGWIAHSEEHPGSAVRRHPDGQPVVQQSASNLRLAPLIEDFKEE